MRVEKNWPLKSPTPFLTLSIQPSQIEEDPFWVPATEEERELYGEGLQSGDSSTGLGNVARDIVNSVRRSKGLVVREDKLVDGADKQRNMSRKK